MGGGLFFEGGDANRSTLAGTTVVRGNVAGSGGGIFCLNGQVEIGSDCRVTQNTAETAGAGGGIRTCFGLVTLVGPDPSPVVTNNCPSNCDWRVPIEKCAAEPISCPP